MIGMLKKEGLCFKMVDEKTILSNLYNLRENIQKIASKTNRSFEDIKVVIASKNIEVDKVKLVLERGFNNLGENKVQEFTKKYDIIVNNVNWHFIGRVQSNKVKYLIDKVSLIHSLDRLSLAKELNRQAENKNIVVEALIQLNLTKEETKTGVYEENLDKFIENIARLNNLKIKGFMTMGPNTQDVYKSRKIFERARTIFVEILSNKQYNLDIEYLSMGMSDDYELALEEGSNMIRVGSTIFGSRY